jgi:hypothetical protein
VGVAVKGVGYRMEPVEEAVVAAALSSKAGPGAVRRMYWEQEAEKNNPPYPYPNPVKAVRLKVGHLSNLNEGRAVFAVWVKLYAFCSECIRRLPAACGQQRGYTWGHRHVLQCLLCSDLY